MAEIAHFQVEGRLNGSDGGSLDIDRERGIVTVRPKGERRTYSLTLLTVAEIVVARVVKQELNAGGVTVPLARRGREGE